MNGKNFIYRVIMPAVLTTIIWSCSVNPCYEDIDPLMKTLLLTSGTGSTATAETLKVQGINGTDTIEFADSESESTFTVSLDPSNDTSLFLITINDIADTAVIYYKRQPHLVSPECGYTIISDLTGLTTTHNIIDTLIIENEIVNLDGNTNLHLFY